MTDTQRNFEFRPILESEAAFAGRRRTEAQLAEIETAFSVLEGRLGGEEDARLHLTTCASTAGRCATGSRSATPAPGPAALPRLASTREIVRGEALPMAGPGLGTRLSDELLRHPDTVIERSTL